MTACDKLLQFLRDLALDQFYGTVTIKFESGKVTHVETETRRHWQYKDLPISERHRTHTGMRENGDG